MRARTLGEVASLMGGQVTAGAGGESTDSLVRGASIDTRTLNRGDLFFCLQGTNVHGREFARQALEAGAAAIVTDEKLSVDGPQVRVNDVQGALAELAQAVREEERSRLPSAVVTGSLGKTTACRYAAELLTSVGVPHRPQGSYNNHLGVPLTVLSAPEESRFLIVEVGANHPGEVLPLATWAQPRVACVTAVAPVHLEGFGSVAGVAREKLSIFEALEPDGEGWIPTEVASTYSHLLGNTRARIRTFGRGGDLEVRPLSRVGSRQRYALRFGHDEPPMSFEWDPPFAHSVSNLEVALAMISGLGVPPEEVIDRISELTLPPLRGECENHAGVEFVLDCYNSSPRALESSISRLETDPASGRRICVLGTMEELGDNEDQWHRRLGEHIASSRVDEVFLVGRGRDWYQEGLRTHGHEGHLLDNDQNSAARLADHLRPGDRVLFKASRRDALERFAERVGRFLDERVT